MKARAIRVWPLAVLLTMATGNAVAAAGEVADARWLTVGNGERLRVTSLGRGEPVILIPGLFGSAYGFRKVMPGLAAIGHEAIVVEPLGVGESDRPAEADYSMTAQADRVAAAMEELGIEHAVVVAHSASASIGLRLAHRHPTRVAALVSIEGGATETAVGSGLRRALRFAPLIRLLGGTGLVRGKIRGQLAERSADPSWVTDEVVDGYTRGPAADLGGTLRALKRMADAREPQSLQAALGEVRCPVRLLIGTASREGGPTPAEVELLRSRLRSFEVERVPNAGHFVFEEAPSAVVEAVQQVGRQVSAGHRNDRSPAG